MSKKSPSKKKTSSRRRKPKATEKSSKQGESVSSLGDRMTVLRHMLGFRSFLASSFEPRISDADIIVCFSDVRGFTAYCRQLQNESQDRKIQNFLRTLVKIYNEGLMSWVVDKTDERLETTNAELKEIERHIAPTMYKNLGDGLMMVWEIPATLTPYLQGRLAQEVVFLVERMSDRFYHHFRGLTPVEQDSYSTEVTKLEIGFGLAKGHAWCLDFEGTLDYAGSVINLASRLASLARPSGIVAQYDLSTWMFDQLVSKTQGGSIATIGHLKGYGAGVKAWISRKVDSSQKEITVERKKGKEKSKEKGAG